MDEYLLLLVFFRGNCIDPMVLENWERAHLKEIKSSSALLK